MGRKLKKMHRHSEIKSWQELRDYAVQQKIQAKEEEKEEVKPKRKLIRPMTKGQEVLWKSIHQKNLTICIGPAGSGKTLLSMQAAAEMLDAGKITRIVLSRPLVGCGGNMGFFPGDVHEKMIPWMSAAIDPLEQYFGKELDKLIESKTIELVPLEIMRGSSFRDSFIFLDEAQNASFTQLKMFLTRIGQNTKMLLTGDVTQADIISKSKNSLASVIEKLKSPTHEKVGVVQLSRADILRSDIVRWLDARLSDEIENENLEDEDEDEDIYSFDCPVCKKECLFDNNSCRGEKSKAKVNVTCVRCWSCKSIIHLPEEFDPDNEEDKKKFVIEKDVRFPECLAEPTFPGLEDD